MSSLPDVQVRENEALRGNVTHPSGTEFIGGLLTPAETPSIVVYPSPFTDLLGGEGSGLELDVGSRCVCPAEAT